jgi:hypothetical protein
MGELFKRTVLIWLSKGGSIYLSKGGSVYLSAIDWGSIHQENPLLPLTRPGDSYLGEALFPLIEALEEAVGKEAIALR